MPPTITVKLENGSATIIQDPDPATLNFGDTVTIGLSGFSKNAQITEVKIYDNATVNKQDAKGSLIGTWSRSNPNSVPIGEVTIKEASNSVTLEDTDATSDEKYWYGLTVVDGSQLFNPDPELIVKKQE